MSGEVVIASNPRALDGDGEREENEADDSGEKVEASEACGVGKAKGKSSSSCLIIC